MVFLNIAEALNDVTRPDESGNIVDSLMAGQYNWLNQRGIFGILASFDEMPQSSLGHLKAGVCR